MGEQVPRGLHLTGVGGRSPFAVGWAPCTHKWEMLLREIKATIKFRQQQQNAPVETQQEADYNLVTRLLRTGGEPDEKKGVSNVGIC